MTLTPDPKEIALKEIGIHIPEGRLKKATLNFGCREILIETPVQLRGGKHDIKKIGAFTYLGGEQSVFRCISEIGRFCAIASNITIGQVQHPTHFLSAHPLFEGEFTKEWASSQHLLDYQKDNAELIESTRKNWNGYANKRFGRVKIGNDVWIGEGVSIMRGVTIGDGSVIAARSVVTKDIPPYSVVGGAPAKVIKMRFSDRTCEALQQLRWWEYGLPALNQVDMSDPESAVDRIRQNIASCIKPFQPLRVALKPGLDFEVLPA